MFSAVGRRQLKKEARGFPGDLRDLALWPGVSGRLLSVFTAKTTVAEECEGDILEDESEGRARCTAKLISPLVESDEE